MTEKTIERWLKQDLEKSVPRAKCLKFISPGFTGVPDRIILLPGGKVVFAELKRPGEAERPRQWFVQDWLRRLGFTVFSGVDSAEKVAAVIRHCIVLFEAYKSGR